LSCFVGDPHLGQKAAGIELHQYAGIDCVGFDLRMRDKADLLWIGDHHPAAARSARRRKASSMTRAQPWTTHEEPNPVRLFGGNYRAQS